MIATIRMKKMGTLMISCLLLWFAFAGVPLLAQSARNGGDAWRQELLKERMEKDAEFKSSATSPMAGSVRLIVGAAGKTFIAILDGNVSAQPRTGKGAVFAVFPRDGKWYWDDAAPDVTCSMGERAVAQKTDALLPGSLFRAGRFTLAAYPGPENMALIVFDPQRPQQLDFKHLLYFPADARYAVPARLEKFPEKREVKIITTRKLEKTFFRYARIHFQLAGRDLALTALKSSLEGPDSDYLFIPFKDATNGEETYEVGRFIDISEPQGEEFILDFNRCYNPLCNYSPAYNCPLPPLENFLDIAVPAGEKTYPH